MVMATNMSIGMSAVIVLHWSARTPPGQHPAHVRRDVRPFLVLLAPYPAGWLGTDTFFNDGALDWTR